MPVYRYTARNSGGARTGGIIDGDCVDDVARLLMSDGLYPSMIEVTGARFLEPLLNRIRHMANPVSPDEIITFTSRFATLLKAGVSVISSLDGLIDQMENTRLKHAVEDITKRVRDGSSLSEAMACHGSVFPKVYVAMVSAGELAGLLDICLERISKLLEWETAIKQRARDVTRYPKILIFGLMIAAVTAFGFVIPRYASVFERVNIPLPAPTRGMILLSGFIQDFWIWGAVAFGCVYLFWSQWVKTESGKAKFDRLVLKAPIIGLILLQVYISRWANTLGSLLLSGIPIVQSLEMSAGSTGNSHVASMVMKVKEEVSEGAGISGPLRRIGLAPPPTSGMVAVGEQAGALDKMFFMISEYFEKEADRRIKTISAYVEPALIMLLSVIVLAMALAVYLPMWEITKLYRGG